jgi:hypothetical protein
MRLAVVESGHDSEQAAALEAMRQRFGTEPMGVQKTLRYRPEIFGYAFSDALQLALRGPSEWSPGERELFAGFTSLLNTCHF